MSFRQRQFLILLFLATVPLLLVSGIVLPITRNFVIQRTREQMEVVADLQTEAIGDWISRGGKLADFISTDILTDLQASDDDISELSENDFFVSGTEHLRTILQSATDIFPEILAISLLHPSTGKVIIATEPGFEGRDRSNELYFMEGQDALYFSPVVYSVGREAPILTVAVPIRDENAGLLTVITIEMNLNDLKGTLANPSGLGDTGRTYLVEAYGFYVTLSNESDVNPLRRIAESEGVRRVLSGQSGFDNYRDPEGISVLGVYRWLPEVNLGLLVEIDETELTSQYTDIWFIVILAELLLFLASIFIAQTLARRLVAPIERISKTARALHGDISQRTSISGSIEIQQLAAAFNDMADSLQLSRENLEATVQERTQALTNTNERLRHEILEREQAEQAIQKLLQERQEEAQKYRALFDQSRDAIFIEGLDGIYVDCNQAAVDMTGYTRDEIVGSTWEELVPPEEHTHTRQATHELLDGKAVPVYERIGQRKNGEKHFVEISVVMIHDAEDNPLHVQTVIRDITQRKRSEAHIREQARILDLIFEHMIDLMVILDKDFNFVRVSQSYASAGAKTVDEFIGLNHFEIYPSDFKEEAEDVKKNKYTYYKERRPFTYADHPEWGVTYWNIGLVPILDEDGEIELFLLNLKDVSENVRAEQAVHDLNTQLEDRVRIRTSELETANRELDAFAYSVSHDLRAPLRAIIGFSQAVQEDYKDVIDEDGQEYLTDIVDAGKKMNELISDMLHLSRVTRTEIIRKDIDLTALARTILQELEQRNPEHQVSYNIQSDISAFADEGLLRIVLDNLLGNAWKFTGKTEQAQIDFFTEEQDGETVYVIRDNGAGFDMSYADKLFGAFQRLHHANDFQGTGIGLATVQRIIHKHQGSIRADAKLDQGASFHFTLSINSQEVIVK